jgi:hypothetical protein
VLKWLNKKKLKENNMEILDIREIIFNKSEKKREYEEEQTYLICVLRCYMHKILDEEPFSDEFGVIVNDINGIKQRLKGINSKLKQIKREIYDLLIEERKK